MSDKALPMKSERWSELPQCESIRGIAALLVFWFHYLGGVYGHAPNANVPVGLGLFFGGSTGVTLFFILSGFLLTRPYFMGRPLDTRQFFAHRALRILPMYYIAILIGALASGHWADAAKALFFYDIGLKTLSPMGAVWWSLVIEVQFYLLLPVFVWLASHKGRRLLLIPLLIAATVIYFEIRNAAPSDQWFGLRDSILGRWPIFLCGAALAWSDAQIAKNHITMPTWLGLPLMFCALAALELLCDHRAWNYGAIDAHIYWFDYHILESMGWTIFIFALLNFRFPGYRLLVNPLLHRVGLWSYSLYLLHSGILFLASRFFPVNIETGLQAFIYGSSILAAATAVSALTYHWIERPFLRLKSQPALRRGRQLLPNS